MTSTGSGHGRVVVALGIYGGNAIASNNNHLIALDRHAAVCVTRRHRRNVERGAC